MVTNGAAAGPAPSRVRLAAASPGIWEARQELDDVIARDEQGSSRGQRLTAGSTGRCVSRAGRSGRQTRRPRADSRLQRRSIRAGAGTTRWSPDESNRQRLPRSTCAPAQRQASAIAPADDCFRPGGRSELVIALATTRCSAGIRRGDSFATQAVAGSTAAPTPDVRQPVTNESGSVGTSPRGGAAVGRLGPIRRTPPDYRKNGLHSSHSSARGSWSRTCSGTR